VARVGADVGGTFTDVVVLEADGRVRFTKVLSTPPDYDRAVVDAVAELHVDSPVEAVVHGTTVATNAVLERRGARTALVTTEGFRDVLELRRMRMPHLYDYFWTKPPSLVPRRARFEVAERVTAAGEVLVPLVDEDVRALARALREHRPEAISVCLLHAHLHPGHERRVGEILRAELPDVPVTLSSEILREQQEYERTATTVVNAYVRPLMERYLGRLRTGLDDAGIDAPLTIMQSSGGVMSAEDCALRPVYALESGPAAGVVAAGALASALGLENVITFDMGGTTAKASLIEAGAVSRSVEYEVGAALSAGSRLLRGSGELIRIPTLDIAEVGAGGGSIARVDGAGALHVGPTSAGAAPGPACYGLGGEDATVTDADVVLGFIPAGRLASGDLTVSRELAEESVARVGDAIGLGSLDAARGIHELANAAMMRALRAVSTEKGRDPADFALLAYGGSGPVHAAALAAELGVRTAVVPPLAGLFSAAGLLYARAERHDVRFCRVSARDGDPRELARLEAEMREHLATGAEVAWQRVADMRYRGQNWSIPVDWPDDLSLAELVDRFERAHERLYGTRLDPGSPVDVRALRLVALGTDVHAFSLAHDWEGPAEGTTRLADFGPAHGTVEVPVRARASITAGPMAGPLLIDEYDTTVVVPPGWTVALDHGTGALVLTAAGVAAHSDHHAPIAVRLVGNALETAADEMATTIFRTAHSAVVRDAMDYSAALCGPTTETIAQAVTIPLQLGSIPNAMRTLVERFGDSFSPGDVYIVNDPFDGASHTPDIFVVKPSFLEGTLLGFAATIAHHADVGGRVPGSCACDSTEVFQEGLRLPWLRLYEKGEPVEALFEILRANVRVPHELLGDLSAQVAACHIGDRALQDLARRYGSGRLVEMMGELLDHTEALLRSEIASWPDGTVSFTDYLDSDGLELREIPITVDLTVRGDELVADFSRSAPMVRGSLNCTPSFAEASVYQTVMAASVVDIPRTAGALRPISVITKPGTVTHVVMPGASSMRGITGYRLSDVMNGALAQLVPARVPAAGEGGSTLAFFTARDGGEQWVYSELVVGTWGGRPVSDGNDGLANPCASMANIPVELAESDWPILIERYGLVPDSGGAGRYRGGLAIERSWRVLAPDTAVHVRSDRQVHRPYGIAGGREGAPSSSLIVRSGGMREQMPPMFVGLLQPGDAFHHRQPGGGGYGDPFEREPEAVALDVLDGKVSVQAARELYGVVVDRDGALDEAATSALRFAR
jgi:N-methylhydantoinase A/oxoprolinase/acetone carboxylase beta subunit/N-methylhydantoinase B/oxoprolinase/acetone carboxylase alpha subunit